MNNHIKTLLYASLFALSTQAHAQQGESPLWMRGAAISPDGRQIAFDYKGDIFVVDSQGGLARQLTTTQAYDGHPFWSPDGKHIAFASDRYGGMDIMVMKAEGGVATRLTTHSAQEFPVGWKDNGHVLLTRAGWPSVTDIIFPSSTFKQVYEVGLEGGRQKLFSQLTMGDLSVAEDGRVLYNNVKGYEDTWRKHHQSPITRDVWMWDGKSYEQKTTFKGEDRNPVWAPDGQHYYYLSQQGGTMNVFKGDINTSKAEQLTHFTLNPVRFLSVSKQGTLCFMHDSYMYTMKEGQQPQKVDVRTVSDRKMEQTQRHLTSNGASNVCVSPKGDEIAFILNGDVYVTSLEYNTTKQITSTVEREREVSFSADGRSLVYDSERGGIWSIYKATIKDKDEKNFTYSTEIKEELLTDGKTTSFSPLYSPDGKQIAYLQNRHELHVMDEDGKHDHVVIPDSMMYSYSDGDQHFTWSPDSKWLLADYIGHGGWCIGDVALVKADGKEAPINLTNSGYSDGSARWALGGKAIIFGSDRAGMRSHGSWGAQYNIYIMFLDTEAYEMFRMNKEELAIKAEGEKKKDKKKDEKKDSTKEEKVKELKFDLDDLEARTFRLTPHSGSIRDAVLSNDGKKLYYLADYPEMSGLWVYDLMEHTNQLRQRGIAYGSLSLSADGTAAYVGSGQITKIDLNSCSTKNIPFEAFSTTYPADRYDYIYEHIWHQTKEKLYDPGMNGANWDSLHVVYKRYLPHINNGYDFAEMASELLGELNVSHTGCRFHSYSPSLSTAELGVLLDESYEGDGLKIAEVLIGSPLYTKKEVTPGSIITHIDGVEVKADTDYFPMLAGKENRYTRLTIKCHKGKTKDITIRPISSGTMYDLLYKRWVARNEQMVDSISGGNVAYVHIKGMDTPSFHQFYKKVLSDKSRQRKALIVDTRHNGGGWLHNDVCTLLSGKRSVRYTPRGQYIGNDPYNKWVKPSCMLTCEDNYSNAHGTPWLYKELGIGPVIGAPVAGTMTAVWWESIGGFTFGIPQVGSLDNRGMYLENQTLYPNIEVYNSPEDQLRGRDHQIEMAVSEMLK